MAREFDIIVYGATGYTGRLVAEHLLKTYGAAGDLKWAMAGRNEAKLKEVRGLIGAPEALPLVIADADDLASLTAMARRATAIISTAGPYQLYGSNLVAVCAAEGTDYVDLTGEPNWIHEMGIHQEAAKKSGARIVFSCGFDSIPFDLGAWFVEEAAKAKFGAYAPRVRSRVRAMKGSASGGTVASGQATMMAVQKNPAVMMTLMNPFALTPGFTGPAQPDGSAPYEDKVTGSWVGPFMMAMINSKAVHRTNFALGHPWGTDFQYDEMVMLPGPPGAGEAPTFAMNNDLKPGDGPSKQEREEGFYDILLIAEMADGRTVRAHCKGDMDPGYGSTSKMLGESAVCLVRDVPRSVTPGGLYSTGGAMAAQLIPRLAKNAGIVFAVED